MIFIARQQGRLSRDYGTWILVRDMLTAWSRNHERLWWSCDPIVRIGCELFTSCWSCAVIGKIDLGVPALTLLEPPARRRGDESRGDAWLLSKAVRMHRLNRLRDRHFLAAVMADSAMDVMLTLFIGELQDRAVDAASLAATNMLAPEEVAPLVDRLVQSGLVMSVGRDGPGPGRDGSGPRLGLSPLSSMQMRSFVGDYPDV
jgi:hypothetical protein